VDIAKGMEIMSKMVRETSFLLFGYINTDSPIRS